jgi:hypothetical protein
MRDAWVRRGRCLVAGSPIRDGCEGIPKFVRHPCQQAVLCPARVLGLLPRLPLTDQQDVPFPLGASPSSASALMPLATDRKMMSRTTSSPRLTRGMAKAAARKCVAPRIAHPESAVASNPGPVPPRNELAMTAVSRSDDASPRSRRVGVVCRDRTGSGQQPSTAARRMVETPPPLATGGIASSQAMPFTDAPRVGFIRLPHDDRLGWAPRHRLRRTRNTEAKPPPHRCGCEGLDGWRSGRDPGLRRCGGRRTPRSDRCSAPSAGPLAGHGMPSRCAAAWGSDGARRHPPRSLPSSTARQCRLSWAGGRGRTARGGWCRAQMAPEAGRRCSQRIASSKFPHAGGCFFRPHLRREPPAEHGQGHLLGRFDEATRSSADVLPRASARTVPLRCLARGLGGRGREFRMQLAGPEGITRVAAHRRSQAVDRAWLRRQDTARVADHGPH